MGDLKSKDLIVVIDVLTSYSDVKKQLIGTVQSILAIDDFANNYKFLVLENSRHYWVDGLPYSSLMMELI